MQQPTQGSHFGSLQIIIVKKYTARLTNDFSMRYARNNRYGMVRKRDGVTRCQCIGNQNAFAGGGYRPFVQPQALLLGLALAHVPEGAHKPLRITEPHVRKAQIHMDRVSLAMQCSGFNAGPVQFAIAGLHVTLHALNVQCSQFRRLQHGYVLTNDFVRGITKNIQRRWVGVANSAFYVEHDDGIGADFPQRAVAQLAITQKHQVFCLLCTRTLQHGGCPVGMHKQLCHFIAAPHLQAGPQFTICQLV